MMKVILELEIPENCKTCPLSAYIPRNKTLDIYCPPATMAEPTEIHYVSEYIDTRAPFCPLKPEHVINRIIIEAEIQRLLSCEPKDADLYGRLNALHCVLNLYGGECIA